MVQPFRHELADRWEEFIGTSRNGYFQSSRRFLAYHGDRFNDASLILSRPDGEWLAVIAAARVERPDGLEFASHPGLTFAGCVLSRSLTQMTYLKAFGTLLTYLVDKGYKHLLYKSLPSMYHAVPSQDDLYGFFLTGAELVGRHILPTIHQRDRLPFQERRSRGAKKASRNGITVRETQDLRSYWAIVDALLQSYGTKPVHSLDEIRDIQARLPQNVRLFAAYRENTMEAGVLVFESGPVARAQYIASTAEGKQSGALDLVFDHLLLEVYVNKPFFEFGTATTDGGKYLSAGICEQKEGFGARSLVQDTYRLKLTEHLPAKLEACLE